jgi:hypothetical protein
MKVFRFRGPSDIGNKRNEVSYAYVRFSLFERLFFRSKIVALALKHDLWYAPASYGPKRFGAQFIMQPKLTSGDRRNVEQRRQANPNEEIPSWIRHHTALPLQAFGWKVVDGGFENRWT